MTKPFQNTLDFLIESIKAKLYKKVRFWENAPNYFKKSAAKTQFWRHPGPTLQKWEVLKICTNLL